MGELTEWTLSAYNYPLTSQLLKESKRVKGEVHFENSVFVL